MNDLEKTFLATLNADIHNIQHCKRRGVSKAFFLYPECSWLYEIIMYHNESYNQVLQADSLQTLLKQSTKISDQTKATLALLFEELKGITPASNFELLIDQLFEYHKFNRVKQTFAKAVDGLSTGKINNVINETSSDLNRIERELSPVTSTSGFFKEDIPNILAEFQDRLAHPEKYKGVMLGIPTIDRATGGLQKGSVTLVIGEQKSGKSVLMTNIVYNLVNAKKRVYYHVNEGGKKLVYNRYISRGTAIPVTHVRDVECMTIEEQQQYQTFLQAEMANVVATDFYIDSVSPASSTIPYLSAKIKEMQTFAPVDLVIVDHMGLMTSTEKGVQSDWEKFGIIALGLKAIAAEHQVPIIAVTHVNREGMKTDDGKDFKLEHIGRSNEPAKHVDLVLSWRIQDPEAFALQNMGDARLSIMAARDAVPTSARIHVNTNIMKIEELVMTIAH